MSMITCSDEDKEIIEANKLLLEKRNANKSYVSKPINSIEMAIKHAQQMAEITKLIPKEPEKFKIDPIPKINMLFPKRFANSTFSNYENTHESHSLLKSSLIESAKKIESAILVGATGTGKTHLAVAYARVLMCSIFDLKESIPSFTLITMIELLSSIIEKTKTMDDYKKVEILILDDLGREKKGDWSDNKIFELINYRYLQMLPTIITTNFKSKELAEKIEQVNVSRIHQMCNAFAVEGEDYRKKNLGKNKPS